MKKGFKGLMLVLLLVALPLMGLAQEEEEPPVRKKKRSNVSYFQKGSLFVYALGTTNSIKAPVDMYYELGPGSASGFAPMVGAGLRVISFGKIMFLNLTFDAVTGKFDFVDSPEQKVNMFTVMLDLEAFLFKPTPLSVNFGVGVTFARFEDMGYWDIWDEWVPFGDETVTAMAIELGSKLAVSKNIYLRAILRFTGELLPDYSYDYWDDDESDFVRFNTAFGFGVEFHF